MDPPDPRAATARRRALLATFLVPLAVVIALGWPLAADLGDTYHPSTFGPSHAWVGDQIWRALTGGDSLLETRRAGYPWPRSMRIIGWVPLVGTLPLRPLLGPLAAFNLATLFSLPLSALACWPLVRRWTGADPWSAAAACVAFALCPFALGTLATGELPKLQVGLLPLFLYAQARALDDPRPLRWLLAIAALALATAFTEPYFGLLLPLLGLGACGAAALRQRHLGRPGAALLALALGLSPAFAYFQDVLGGTARWLFMPARSGPPQRALPSPHPVANLQDLLLGVPAPLQDAWDPRHVAYLGTPLALALLVLALLRRGPRPGQRAALALLACGAVLSLGPWLFVGVLNTDVPLPALVFRWLGYPLAQGGMYYRLAVLGSLGLALWLAVRSSERPRLAWLLLSLQVGDAVRASAPWPLPARPVPFPALLPSLPGEDGAVLELPVDGGLVLGQQGLLRALLHGRPTTALPRHAGPGEGRLTVAFWEEALRAEEPAAALRRLGVRYVVRGGELGAVEARAVEQLGTALAEQDGLALWDLGPTQPRWRRAGELVRPAGEAAVPPGAGPPRPRGGPGPARPRPEEAGGR